MGMNSDFAQIVRQIRLKRSIVRALALCAGALFLAGLRTHVRPGRNAHADAPNGGSCPHVHIYA